MLPDDLAPPGPPKLAKIQWELREKRLARADAEEARLRQQIDGLDSPDPVERLHRRRGRRVQ